MLDSLRIRSHLKDLREKLFKLETKFKALSEEEFLANSDFVDIAEHNLQVAIQNCIDIANHIIAALVLPSSKNEISEAFFTLAKEGILSKDLANKMKSAVGYRNVVVHGYLIVNHSITYENIQKHLQDLVEFGKEIEEFLEKWEKDHF